MEAKRHSLCAPISLARADNSSPRVAVPDLGTGGGTRPHSASAGQSSGGSFNGQVSFQITTDCQPIPSKEVSWGRIPSSPLGSGWRNSTMTDVSVGTQATHVTEDVYDHDLKEWVVQHQKAIKYTTQSNYMSWVPTDVKDEPNDIVEDRDAIMDKRITRITLVVAIIMTAVPAFLVMAYDSELSVEPFTSLVNVHVSWKGLAGVVIVMQLIHMCRMSELSWGDVFSTLATVWFSMLPWLREVPMLPIMGILLLVFAVAAAVNRISNKEISRKLTRLSAALMIIVLTSWWFYRYFYKLYPPDDQYALSSAPGQSCRYHEIHVFERKHCAQYGQQEGLPTGTGFELEDSDLDRCCVVDPVAEANRSVHMWPGKCALGQPFLFVCKTVQVPEMARPAYKPLRMALQAPFTNGTELNDTEVRCSWGYRNLLLEDQTEVEEEVCWIFTRWAVLQMSSAWIAVMGFGWVLLLTKSSNGVAPNIETTQDSTRRLMVVLGSCWLFYYLGLSVYGGFRSELIFGLSLRQFNLSIIFLILMWVCKEYMVAVMAQAEGRDCCEKTREMAALVHKLAAVEWVQALILMTLLPLWIIMVLISWMRELCCKSDHSARYTKLFLGIMKGWRWTRILSLMYWLGMARVVLCTLGTYGFKLTLSWVDAELDKFPVEESVLVFGGFALTVMLCIPVMNGIVVYVGCGLLLGPRLSSLYGWPGAVGSCVAVCFCCKILAHYTLYCVGRCISRCVSLRDLIGLDTLPMLAFKFVLERPREPHQRLAAVHNGFDWLTPVLCGMFGVSHSPCSMYPALYMILPAVISGMTVHAHLASPVATISSMTLLGAIVIQEAFGYTMYRAVSLAIRDEALISEQLQIPTSTLHQPRESRPGNDLYMSQSVQTQKAWSTVGGSRVTLWTLPSGAKVSLVIAAMCPNIATIILLCAPTIGFEPFRHFDLGADFYAPLSENGLDGNYQNIFTPLGKWCIAVIPTACLFYVMTWVWASMEGVQEQRQARAGRWRR